MPKRGAAYRPHQKRPGEFTHEWCAPYGGAQHRGRVEPGRGYMKNMIGPPCRTLADMTEDEIQALEREYGCPVIRPQKTKRRTLNLHAASSSASRATVPT